MKNIFQEFHLGQKVNCCNHGNGIIRSINMASSHPITVDFNPRLVEYKVDGTPILGELPTLSFGHKSMEFDYGTPEEPETRFDLDLFMKGELAKNREGRHVEFIGICEACKKSKRLVVHVSGDSGTTSLCMNGKYFSSGLLSREDLVDMVGCPEVPLQAP